MFELEYLHQDDFHFTYFNSIDECLEFIRLFDIEKYVIVHWEEYEKDKS